MKKITTIFERDWHGNKSLVLDVPHPDCSWVFVGEGVATRKYDGTSCLYDGSVLWRRREVKSMTLPPDFVAVEYDQETGKTIGWVPVGDTPEDRWHREALYDSVTHYKKIGLPMPIGTYELLGPKIQGNPERRVTHTLLFHGHAGLEVGVPRTFAGMKDWLNGRDIEGIVFHHPDGRMGKIKLRDFGLTRGVRKD